MKEESRKKSFGIWVRIGIRYRYRKRAHTTNKPGRRKGGKWEEGGMDGMDGDGVWRRQRPPAVPNNQSKNERRAIQSVVSWGVYTEMRKCGM